MTETNFELDDERLNDSLSDIRVQNQTNLTLRRHNMSIKAQKLVAKSILKEIDEKNIKPKVAKAEYKGLQYNEKGQFHSAIFEVELVIPTAKGEVNFLKDLQIPINIRGDMNIPEPPKPEKKEGKPKAVTNAKPAIGGQTKDSSAV